LFIITWRAEGRNRNGLFGPGRMWQGKGSLSSVTSYWQQDILLV
jgi:hypothetical protein